MALTTEDVRWIAHLARLELTEAELETMARQLTSIIDYVTQLQQVDTEPVEPALLLQRVVQFGEEAGARRRHHGAVGTGSAAAQPV